MSFNLNTLPVIIVQIVMSNLLILLYIYSERNLNSEGYSFLIYGLDTLVINLNSNFMFPLLKHETVSSKLNYFQSIFSTTYLLIVSFHYITFIYIRTFICIKNSILLWLQFNLYCPICNIDCIITSTFVK